MPGNDERVCYYQTTKLKILKQSGQNKREPYYEGSLSYFNAMKIIS